MTLNVNILSLLQETTVSLAMFLEKLLPNFSQDWWVDIVLKSLSYQQKQYVEKSKSDSLKSLDFAALLRILDQNWYQISTTLGLSPADRHFVKEMQTVRNRWAHAGSEGFSEGLIYRDLDTLQRFSAVIEADEHLIKKIKTAKASILINKTSSTEQIQPNDNKLLPDPEVSNEHFQPGQIVLFKSDPNVKGVVISMLLSDPENRYMVFVNGDTSTFYESQLQSEDQQDDKFLFLSVDEFHSHLTALQIKYPGLSTLYSLNAARIDFIPYQFRPVMRFIRSDRPRLLVADGVGVGKTIEAGLILRELQARRDVRSILIVCPRPLIIERKWQIEMKRFDENFVHLDGSNLRYCINEMDLEGAWPDQYQRVIIPYSLFDEAILYGTDRTSKRKIKKGLLDLDPPPRFDLVIIDEAHHIRNQDTFRHKAVNFFCNHAEAVVFLTATTIQLGNHDLFVLLNTLRPDLIIDQQSFEHMAEPNPFINEAIDLARVQKAGWTTKAVQALDKAIATPWGKSILKHNPIFQKIRGLVCDNQITLEQRIQIITDLEKLHTFSGIINRTRRRDIGDFTIRKPETVVVEFTEAQKEIHDELLKIQEEIFSKIHGDVSINFLLTTIRRQAASCLFGLVPFLNEILNRHIDELVWDEADNSGILPETNIVDSIETRISSILEKAQKLKPHDPKLEALRKIIMDKQALQNNKIMLFSSFRHTLSYLYYNLEQDGFRVGMVNGDTPDEERIDFRQRFEMKKDEKDCLDILLFSEIGCEGLDYQFCDCIVNYDLPWNPMRIEQRIGRIDRNGQKSETVAICNLITPGTVDADIYERCLMRIGVFNSALGGGEEILGEITKQIRNIAENFSLTKEERNEQLQQLADNKIRLIQEQEKLEEKQVELFGIRLPQAQIKQEIEASSSFWLSPSSIYRFLRIYFKNAFGKDKEYILGEKPLKSLRLSQEARNKMLKDFRKLQRQKTSTYREWENWLKGGNPLLSITFEAECASQHPEAAFIMPLHPLLKQAAYSFNNKERIVTHLNVTSDEVPIGDYLFAIYQWHFLGIKEDLILQPIASSEDVTEHLPNLLKKAKTKTIMKDEPIDLSTWDNLDTQHYKLWSDARKAHQQRTQELAEYRRESLTTSHNARISLLREQLLQSNNDKIKIMRQSQIATAEADYARRIQELDIAMERAELTASPVAYGFLTILGSKDNANERIGTTSQ